MTQTPPSIQHRLLVALIGTLLVVWFVVLLLVYRAARHEVQEVFDADLARGALTLQTLLLHEVDEEQAMTVKVRKVLDELGSEDLARYPHLASILSRYTDDPVKERLELVGTAQQAGHRYGAGLVFVARYGDGSIMLRDSEAPEIPLTEPGYANLELGGQWWRLYRHSDPQTGFTVQVGERQAFRADLVRYITRNTLMPLLLALPVLALLTWLIVGRVLAPLQRVAHAVSQRAPDTLEAINEQHAPREVHSLIQALNKLFARVGSMLERERQFTADVAHELRTPLAALKAHLQVAQARSPDAPTRDSIDQALHGVDRAAHSVEQLLQLARIDSEQTRSLVDARVDLRDVAMTGVALLSQFAFERNIDLGVEADNSIYARGDQNALQIMLRNLIDNAVRYTPAGGTVTVAIGEDRGDSWISVRDDGPGIAAGDEDKIFTRFHRGAVEKAAGSIGSGLGLSIVQRIARLHGARIELGTGVNDRGLGIKIVIPP